MVKNIYLTILLFLTLPTPGSFGIFYNDSIQSSKELTLANSEEIVGVVGYDTSGVYLLKKDYSYVLEKYSPGFQLLTTSRLKFHKGLRSRNLEKVIFFHDSLYFFISEYRFNTTNLYVQRIDKFTLKPIDKESLIYSQPNVKGNYPDFTINYSLERSKILIVATTDLGPHKTKIFEYLVFTSGMQKLWYRKDTYIYNHQPPKNFQFIVDEDGIVYMSALIYEVKWLSHFDEPLKAQYIVVRYTNNGEVRDHHIFDFINKYPRGTILVPRPGGTFVCVGLVSDNFEYGVSGVFFQTINPQNWNLKPLRILNFDVNFLKELNEGEIFKSGELYGYDLRDAVLRENGDIVLAAEQTFAQDYDNSNHIMAIGFNEFGDISWKQIIRKKQSGTDNISFKLIAPVHKDEVKIIYNESTENTLNNLSVDRKSFFYLDNSYVCLRSLDDRGFITSDSLLFRNHKEPAFDPKFTYDNRKGEVMIIATRYRKFKFIKLNLFAAKEF